MGLKEQLPKPVEYVKDVRDQVQAQRQKQLFFKEQFQKMVENGNVGKAVDLIYDEAENLNVRLNKEVTPRDLAQYCLEKCEEIKEEQEKLENFERCSEKLRDKYDVSIEESD